MKTIVLHLSAVIFLFASCAKENARPAATNTTKPDTKGAYLGVEQLPNEIVPLLYKNLVKDRLFDQADQLSKAYYATF